MIKIMIFLMILFIILGFVISAIIFGMTGSSIGFIICGVILLLFILIKFFAWLQEEFPIVMIILYLIATIVCASISVSNHSFVPILACQICIAALKWGFICSDIDTSWYDTDYYSIDGKLYAFFDSDREGYILTLGLLVFVGIYLLLLVPYFIFKSAFLAFLPSVFFGIALIKTIVLKMRY